MKNNKKMIGLYFRQTTEKNEVNDQQIECTRVANQLFGQEIDIICYKDEGSGTSGNFERNRMLNDVKQGKLDVIITYKVCRISCTPSYALKIVKQIHNANVRFFSIMEGEYTTHHTNPIFDMLEDIVQIQSNAHAERIRKAVNFKREGVHNEK